MQSIDDAYRMLEAFASVGTSHFDMTFLDIEGVKRGFRAQQSPMQVRNSLPKLLPGLTERRNSLIVRPHTGEATLIQLDDLDLASLDRVRDVAFLTLATSPNNFQAWVAVACAEDPKELARRLRKGTSADASASGATRVAGTANYKKKYAPNFPMVRIESVVSGRIVTPERLEQLGLLAANEADRIPSPIRVSSRSWPDYQRCVVNAPLNHAKTGPDISRADFFFALLAAQRGWSVEDIAAQLMEESAKARENGIDYARITAVNAIAAAERGRQRSRA